MPKAQRLQLNDNNNIDWGKVAEWKERNRLLKIKRDEMKAEGTFKTINDSAITTAKQIILERDDLTKEQKKKIATYLYKLLKIQHTVAKQGSISEYLDVVEIRKEFSEQLELPKKKKEFLNELWKKYKI